jgi:hypothetical protein
MLEQGIMNGLLGGGRVRIGKEAESVFEQIDLPGLLSHRDMAIDGVGRLQQM